jgi:hypothetical protein
MEYKAKCYYWELIKIMQKTLVIIFLFYYDQEVKIKGILILIVLIGYYFVSCTELPYLECRFNRIELLC